MLSNLQSERQTTVLLVDDEPAVRHGLQRFLAADPRVQLVAESERPEAACRIARERHPDLILADLSLGGTDGLAMIKTLRAEGFTGRVLVLTLHTETLYAEPALCAGADGYLMKADAPDALPEAMDTVMNGVIYLSPAMQQHLLARWDASATAPVPREFCFIPRRLLRLLLRLAFSDSAGVEVSSSDQARLRRALPAGQEEPLTALGVRFLREWLRAEAAH